MQLVVLNDRPSKPNSPSRCNVNVSSSPSARLLAAERFADSNSFCNDTNAAFAWAYVGWL